MNDPTPSAPTSARLTWRRLDRSNTAALLRVARDEDVRRFLLDGRPVADGWADAERVRSDGLWAQHGVGLWMLERDGDVVGLAGFRVFETHGPEPEAVVALLPAAWGLGLGAEALGALQAVARRRGWQRLCASTDGPNERSLALMARCGFVPAGRTPGPFGETLHFVDHPADAPLGWRGRARFDVTCDWQGAPAPPGEHASVTLIADGPNVIVEVDAPWFGDPPPPPPAGPRDGLWDYEVVELMLLGDDDRYLELELGPHGHHLALLLHGRRRAVARALPLLVDTVIDGARWRARATLPSRWLPWGLRAANAYAMHGVASGRRHLAWRAVPGAEPDFHRLEHFGALP